MVAPFKIVALYPIQTLSLITTGFVLIGGLFWRFPTGESAIVSARRAAGAIGWKSESAIVTPPAIKTYEPIEIFSEQTKEALAM